MFNTFWVETRCRLAQQTRRYDRKEMFILWGKDKRGQRENSVCWI